MNTIKSLESLVSNLNKAMVLLDKATSKPQVAQLAELLANLNQISGDVASVSGKLRGKEAKETIDLIHRLLWRLDDLDKAAIKKFLQEEGIKAKLF